MSDRQDDNDRQDDDAEDEPDTHVEPRLRLIVATDTSLANVLGVSRAAIFKAERVGRIGREPNGTWEVLTALERWRRYVNPLLQREVPAWLNPEVALTDVHRMCLARRARNQGGQVFEDEGAGDGWHDLPDIAVILRAGTPLSYFSEVELNVAVLAGDWWYDWGLMHAESVARRLGCESVDAVRAALHAEMRETLATLADDYDE